MERLSLTTFPQHLIHPDHGVTAIILIWALAGIAVTGFGGRTATRSKGDRTRLAVGIALTVVGVAVLGTAVFYHNSLMQSGAQSWS